MAGFYRNNANGGANGVGVTTANSDDNGAGDALSVSTAGTRTYDSSWSIPALTQSFHSQAGAGVGATLGWSNGTEIGGVFRCYFKMAALPASTTAVLQTRTPAANVGELQIQANGRPRLTHTGGTALYSSAVTLAINTSYRLEWRVQCGLATNNGISAMAIYEGDSSIAIDSFSSTAANTGITTISDFRWGKLTTSGSPDWETWIAAPAYHDGGTAFLGPYLGDPNTTNSQTNGYRISAAPSPAVLDLDQDSGTAASIAWNGSAFIVNEPAHSDVLRYTLSDGVTDEAIVTAPMSLDNTLIFHGGDASDPSDWA